MFGRVGVGRSDLGGDEVLDPLEVALRGTGAVLQQRGEIAVLASGALAARSPRTAGLLEPGAERLAAAFEQPETSRDRDVAAERELQHERLLVVGALVVGQQQLDEHLVAALGDAVGLAGSPARR